VGAGSEAYSDYQYRRESHDLAQFRCPPQFALRIRQGSGVISSGMGIRAQKYAISSDQRMLTKSLSVA